MEHEEKEEEKEQEKQEKQEKQKEQEEQENQETQENAEHSLEKEILNSSTKLNNLHFPFHHKQEEKVQVNSKKVCFMFYVLLESQKS